MGRSTPQVWIVRFTAAADADFEDIVIWTAQRFGRLQAERYAEIIRLAAADLTKEPDRPGSRRRDDILPGIRTLQVSRQGRRGRHLLVYRVAESTDERPGIDILRILHDAMDLAQHLRR